MVLSVVSNATDMLVVVTLSVHLQGSRKQPRYSQEYQVVCS